MSKSKIALLEQEGKFPARIRITDRACGWYDDEVQAWIDCRPLASEVPPDSGVDPVRLRAAREAAAEKRREAEKLRSTPTSSAA